MKDYLLSLILALLMVTASMALEPANIKKVEIKPEKPKTGDEIIVEVEISDSTSRAEITWSMNEKEMGGAFVDNYDKTASIGKEFKAGDKLKIVVTPFDLSGLPGKPQTKNVAIRNAPPDVELKSQMVKDNTYVAELEAKDPEGGKLEYSLLESPEGMEIDEAGKITWEMAPEEKGDFEVKIMVKDPEEQKVVVNLNFTISRKTYNR
jgi:hypothetical protein